MRRRAVSIASGRSPGQRLGRSEAESVRLAEESVANTPGFGPSGISSLGSIATLLANLHKLVRAIVVWLPQRGYQRRARSDVLSELRRNCLFPLTEKRIEQYREDVEASEHVGDDNVRWLKISL